MARSSFLIGVDLGQAQDFTALVVLELLEYEGEWDAVTFTHRTETSVRLRHVERLPLGTSYPDVVARVKQVVESPSLAGGKKSVVVDATGVGRPVVDLLERAGLPCRIWPVSITGGASETTTRGTYRVPKRDLIVGLQVRLQEGELQIAAGLREGAALIRELGEMRVSTTGAGREKYGAKAGEHDDLVLAVALACWGVGKLWPRVSVGPRGDGRVM